MHTVRHASRLFLFNSRIVFALLAAAAQGCSSAAGPIGPSEDPAASEHASAPSRRAPESQAESVECHTEMHTEGAGIQDLGLRWPGGIVRYYLWEDGTEALSAQQKINFHEAVTNIELRTPVRFKEYDKAGWDALPGSADILRVVNDPTANSSHSKVGRQGGTQNVVLGSSNGPTAPRTIMHELGHALGLRHEAQRSDRTTVLTVCSDNSSDASQYDVRTDVDFLTPYDIHSIMHYFQNEFFTTDTPDATQCGGNTMALVNPSMNTFPFMPTACTVCPPGGACSLPCTYIGWGPQYSAEDINALTLMYGRALMFPTGADAFATAMAIADFDRDGRPDLMVGAPGKLGQGGAVLAYKGTFRGIAPWKTLVNAPAAGDGFGQALVTGDFNHDGFPDLAVGAPKRAISGQPRSGTVTVYYGGDYPAARFTPDCASNPICQGGGFPDITARFALSPKDVPGQSNVDGDLFGSALAVADFDNDGFDDLVVGAPGKANGAGRVFVYSGKGIETGSPAPVMLGASAKGAFGNFGSALATGDLNGDGTADISIGAPSSGTGHVSIFQTLTVSSFTERVVVSPPSGVVAGDRFGAALTTARLAGGTRPAFLAVGAPLVRMGGGEVVTYNVSIGFGGVWLANLSQELLPTATLRGQYGAALAAIDLDKDRVEDLVVGAPDAGSKAGAIEMLRASGGTVSHWNQVLSPNGTAVANFGAAFAVGLLPGDLGVPQIVDTPRLLVGSPALTGAYPFIYNGAGRLYSYSVSNGGVVNTGGVGEEYTTKYAGP